MKNFLFQHTFSWDDYRDRTNRALLLNSLFDKMVDPKQKTAMRLLCPSVSELTIAIIIVLKKTKWI